MKRSLIVLSIMLVFSLTPSIICAQHSQVLAKIRVDENGHVEVLDDNETSDNIPGIIAEPSTERNHTDGSNQKNPGIIESQSVHSDQFNDPPEETMSPGQNLTYVSRFCSYTYDYPKLTVHVRIINNGTSYVSQIWLIIYASQNTIIGDADDQYITNRYSSGLAPGAYVDVSSPTVDVKRIFGEFYVGFMIDPLDEIAEDNESDNSGYLTPTIENPLPLVNLYISNGDMRNWDFSINYPYWTANIRVENEGILTAGPSRIGYYFSEDNNITTSDILIGYSDVPALSSRTYSDQKPTINFSSYPGYWYIAALVDDLNEVDEGIFEDDNISMRNWFYVQSPPPITQCDLVVTSVQVLDSEGPDIICKLTVKNQGSETTNAGFKNRIYLSQDKTITSSDYHITDWNVTSLIGPGASKTSSEINTTVSGVPTGGYYLGVITDGNNEVVETNETNNTGYANSPKVNISQPPTTQPDLIVTGVTVTDGSGPQIAYQYSIQNQGSAGTGSGFTNFACLSTDQNITQSDTKIGETQCSTLNAGATCNSGPVQNAVSNLPAGEYYFGIIADANRAIWESIEDNNTGYANSPKVNIPEQEMVILDVPMAETSPVIDGNMDALWKSVCSVPLEQKNLSDDIAPEDWLDCSAFFRMMFDENNYYLFIETCDDIPNISNAQSWENDSFEIYFDGDNSKNDQITGYDNNDIQLRYVVGETTEDMGHAPHSECKFKNTENGYNMEIRIPAQDMTFALSPGHTFGFEIQMNDNDSGQRDHCLKWWSASNDSWINPGLFGTAHTTDYIASNPMRILQVQDIPVIDGVADDAAWTGIPWISGRTFVTQSDGNPLDPPFDINHVNGWNDCRFNYKMIWQDGRLYFYSDVFDDIISTSQTEQWMNDGFQIFVDGSNDKTESRNANDGEVNFLYGVETDGDQVFTQTASGWTIEARIFLTADFGIVPNVGELMGMEVRLGDNDGSGRDLWTQWWNNDDIGFSNPGFLGTVQFAGLAGEIISDVKTHDNTAIQTFHLYRNYPNPFNPSTTIRFILPKACFVTLKIYNLLGKEVATLLRETRAAGEYSVQWNGENLAAGIYFLRMKAGEFIETRKLILQK